MSSEGIEIHNDRISITFHDRKHDAITTAGLGLVRGVGRIEAGGRETSFRDGILYIRTEGRPANFSVSRMTYNTTNVTAVSFADLRSGLERAGKSPQSGMGEILVILILEMDVPDAALARAAITSTEAITASLQDLGLAYDSFSASGSRTQNLVVVCDKGSTLRLRGAGKHTKLGELIGRTTIESVKASAELNGISIASRRSVVSIMASCGYSKSDLFRLSGCEDKESFDQGIALRDSDPKAVGAVSAALHVHNEMVWGLMDERTALTVASEVVRSGLGKDYEGSDPLQMLAISAAHYLAGQRCGVPDSVSSIFKSNIV